MIYREAPRTPPRLLLRIATTAGVGVLLAGAACSSRKIVWQGDPETDASTDDGSCLGFGCDGSNDEPETSAGSSSGGIIDCCPGDSMGRDHDAGSLGDANLDAASDADGPPTDATTDAPDDASNCHRICGSVTLPPDGGQDASLAPCVTVCGTTAMPDE
jgi:hypothetical protein